MSLLSLVGFFGALEQILAESVVETHLELGTGIIIVFGWLQVAYKLAIDSRLHAVKSSDRAYVSA